MNFLTKSMKRNVTLSALPWSGARAVDVPRPVRLARYAGEVWLRRYRWTGVAALVGFAIVYGAAFATYGRVFLLSFLLLPTVMALWAVWLLPDTERAPTVWLTRLTFAYLVVLVGWPDYLAVSLPGLPWITAVRLIGFPLVAILLICISISRPFKRELSSQLAGFPTIGRLVVAFSAIAFLSIFLSAHVGNSVSKFIVAQVSWTAVFFASVYVFSKPGRVVKAAYMLWGLALLQLAIGVWEYKNSRVPWAGHIPWFLKIEDEAVQRILAGGARAATGIYRVQARFTTSLGLAEFLALTLPFILHISVVSRKLVVRWCGIATIPALFWLILKTDSRLGVIGFFMTLLLYILFWGLVRQRRERGSIFGPAIVASYPAIFVGFVTATFFVRRLRNIVWGGGAQQSSNDSREAMYRDGIPIVLRNPIGHGIGEGAITLGFSNGAGVLTIDTYYLAVALEYGIIGFIVFYGMILAAILRSATTAYRTHDPEILYLGPIAITLANFFIIKSVFSQQENHPLIFAMLGMVVALVARQRMLDREGEVRHLG